MVLGLRIIFAVVVVVTGDVKWMKNPDIKLNGV